jgi:hypothetical protein
MNFIILVFSKFNTSLLAENLSVSWERAKCAVLVRSSKFLLEIRMIVSSANDIGIARGCILKGRSFI